MIHASSYNTDTGKVDDSHVVIANSAKQSEFEIATAPWGEHRDDNHALCNGINNNRHNSDNQGEPNAAP